RGGDVAGQSAAGGYQRQLERDTQCGHAGGAGGGHSHQYERDGSGRTMMRALVVAAVAAAVVSGCRSEQKASATPANEPVVTVGAENTVVVGVPGLRAGADISRSAQ